MSDPLHTPQRTTAETTEDRVWAPRGDDGWPSVSVVIPLRNDATAIAGAVESCVDQDYPGDLEVIIAEGASSDASRIAAAALAGRHSRVRVVDNPGGTAAAGLNRAIRTSSGSVIVRCDARAVLPAGYVRRAVELLEATGAVNVGGMQRPVGVSVLQRAIALAMASVLGAGDSRFRIGGAAGPTDTVYLGVFRRDAIEQLGLYDERFLRNQDYELNWRIREAGGTVFFDPGLEVGYRPRGNFKDLAKQYWEYGRWKRRMLGLHPRSIRLRQVAAPSLVIGLALSVLLALTPWRIMAIVVPGVYTVALLAAGGVSWWRARDAAALLLPAVYPTMHLSWGLGFLLAGPLVTPEERSGEK